MMKNLPWIVNGLLLLAIIHLYTLYFSKNSEPLTVSSNPPMAHLGGVRIAYINADTLDAKYEWLKKQKEALKQRLSSAEGTMASKQEALQNDFMKFQQKAESGNYPRAELEKEAEKLEDRRAKMAEEGIRLEKQLGEEQKKAVNDLYANVEKQLKELQAQIGYDYILSYSRGGQILLANDSLDITVEVLKLLNAQKK